MMKVIYTVLYFNIFIFQQATKSWWVLWHRYNQLLSRKFIIKRPNLYSKVFTSFLNLHVCLELHRHLWKIQYKNILTRVKYIFFFTLLSSVFNFILCFVELYSHETFAFLQLIVTLNTKYKYVSICRFCFKHREQLSSLWPLKGK